MSLTEFQFYKRVDKIYTIYSFELLSIVRLVVPIKKRRIVGQPILMVIMTSEVRDHGKRGKK